jgi:hypothetical protein
MAQLTIASKSLCERVHCCVGRHVFGRFGPIKASERGEKGVESRVTQAIRRVKLGAEPSLARLKRQIEERAGEASAS